MDNFIHKVYVHVARKIYKNVYLFEKNILSLQIQKNNRELEIIVQECIMLAIRDSIPTETIIRAYLDESVEQEEEVIIENIEEPVLATPAEPEQFQHQQSESPIINKEEEIPEIVPSIKNMDNEPVITRLSFNDLDSVLDGDDQIKNVSAPKTIEQLEKISMERMTKRKLEEEEDANQDRISISTDPIDLSGLDILDIDGNKDNNLSSGLQDEIMLDFEEL